MPNKQFSFLDLNIWQPGAALSGQLMFKRVWNSPTLNTWASLFGRTLGAVLVLPLVLKKFPVEDFNVWSLFSTLLGLQLVVDMGFCVTFVRAIPVALADADSPRAFQPNATVAKRGGPNWELVSRFIGSMRFIYQRLALLDVLLLAIVGSAALAWPIGLSPQPRSAWLAWGIVVVSGYVNLRRNYLGVLLQDLNEIALLLRWEAITSVAMVLTEFVVLLLGGDLIALVASMQIWTIVATLRNRWLCQQVAQQRFAQLPEAQKDPEIMALLWPATWPSSDDVPYNCPRGW